MRNFLIFLGCCIALNSEAATIPNLVLTSKVMERVSRTVPLVAGQSARVLSIAGRVGPNSKLVEIVDGIRVTHSPITIGLVCYGPSQLEFAIPDNLGEANLESLLTLSTEGSGSPTSQAVTNIPSNAVVIPADRAGPVTILLESSVDLITWNAALPAQYATSTTSRFFRVRAIRAANP